MKSKYFLTLILIGILPVIASTGVYFWMAATAEPASSPVPVDNSPLNTSVTLLQTQISTLASSFQTNITSTYTKLPDLVKNHSATDLETFLKSHPGLAGLAVFSMDGKTLNTVPATAQLANSDYGSSDEFKKMIARFQEAPGKVNLFYTMRLNYPAFVFSIPLDSKTLVQAVMNLAYFFPNSDPQNGEMVFLDGESGQIFYDSNPSKDETSFNPNQDPWLDKIQKALQAKQTGNDLNPPTSAVVYATLGIKAFGLAQIVPFAMLQPRVQPASKSNKPGIEDLPEFLQTPTGKTLLITIAASLGWILLVGSLCLGMILKPLRKASALVLNAAQGKAEITLQSAKAFGNDEVGQMVQAASQLLQKLEQDKQQAAQEMQEVLRRGRAEVDVKSKEAANQVAAAQQTATAAKNEANEKNQQLNDKLKELDALKGMSEGLRNQTEQAKAEIAKLKGQAATAEQGKAEVQQKLTQAQAQFETQLQEMEGKLLSVVASSSPIQVSQVRAAAIHTMSEELKTTLGIIKGYVSSALGSTQSGISEKQQEFLGMVINRSARLEKFINDLVDIYQVEIEQAKAQYEEINLASEIEGSAFNFQAQAEVKNLKIKVETKGTVPKVPVVRRRFTQLWNILYLQMIKDAPRGSNIPITVETIGETVKVTVQDPGLVVVPESLPRLFDEFYDPKHPASTQLAGTGLKLALVKTILAANGGGAVAEKGDPGTRLILTFPTKIKKSGEVPSPSIGLPKPAPSIGASPAIPPPPPPGLGLLKPAVSPLGAPKPLGPVPGVKAATPGLLDSLIAKVPPVTAPGLKPPPPMAPSLAPPASKPPMPSSPAPAPPSPPAAGTPVGTVPKPPTATSSLLDSLMEKKPAPPSPAAPPSGIPAIPAGGGPSIPSAPSVGAPKPVIPPAGAPAMAPNPAAPSMPGMPPLGAPAAPKPPVPGIPAGAGPSIPSAPSVGAPKPVIPPAGAPAMAPKPAAPSMPGMPPLGAPVAPKPLVPGIGAPGMPPGAAPAAPKVVPTSVKPTTPPPGIIDLDNMDGMKLNVGAPKAPPVPGAPPPLPGTPKPPTPGVPPGGLDASKAQKAKEGDGELIE